ncbi:hypothetical protein B0H14DRAFT_3617505 [Mycena olivaceomarginata]|nr:hypothetical protein B0H14DRAFT_3617505 [Mycena olivaceomarginata]
MSPNNGHDLFVECLSCASVRTRWEVSGNGHDMGRCESVEACGTVEEGTIGCRRSFLGRDGWRCAGDWASGQAWSHCRGSLTLCPGARGNAGIRDLVLAAQWEKMCPGGWRGREPGVPSRALERSPHPGRRIGRLVVLVDAVQPFRVFKVMLLSVFLFLERVPTGSGSCRRVCTLPSPDLFPWSGEDRCSLSWNVFRRGQGLPVGVHAAIPWSLPVEWRGSAFLFLGRIPTESGSCRRVPSPGLFPWSGEDSEAPFCCAQRFLGPQFFRSRCLLFGLAGLPGDVGLACLVLLLRCLAFSLHHMDYYDCNTSGASDAFIGVSFLFLGRVPTGSGFCQRVCTPPSFSWSGEDRGSFSWDVFRRGRVPAGECARCHPPVSSRGDDQCSFSWDVFRRGQGPAGGLLREFSHRVRVKELPVWSGARQLGWWRATLGPGVVRQVAWSGLILITHFVLREA